jgi:hypothetical protein
VTPLHDAGVAGEPAPFVARLRAAERSLRGRRAELLDAVTRDPVFQREDVTLYPFNPLDNVDAILRLIEHPAAPSLERLPSRTMIDIGCANGELGLAFEEAGFSVALLDRSHVAEAAGSTVRQHAPLVASIIARNIGSRAVIFDEDIDDGFDPRRVLDGFSRTVGADPPFERFGIGVMVGVLYHLRNPYSAIEKLRSLCDHLIVGTWVADCMPDRRRIIGDDQLVYLLRDRQLAEDPSNYWIFTRRSFHVLVERCGWRILAEHVVTQGVRRRHRWLARLAGRGVSPPDAVTCRMFLLLGREDGPPG